MSIYFQPPGMVEVSQAVGNRCDQP